jgi:hypothetical protein
VQFDIPSITITPLISRQYFRWLLGLYVLTSLIILFAPLAWFYRLVLLSLLIPTGVVQLRDLSQYRPHQVVEATIKSSGRSKVTLGNGRRVKAKLRTDSVVNPWIILLRFDLEQFWRPATMVLFEDALPREQARRLRVLLNHGHFYQ